MTTSRPKDRDGSQTPKTLAQQERQEGNRLLAGGAAVGAVGVAGAVLVGVSCPVCVVAAPALLGAGLYRRWRAGRVGEPPDESGATGTLDEKRS